MDQSQPRPPQRRTVEVVADRDALTYVACELVTAAANLAIGLRGVFTIALAGGSTPRPLYAALARDPDIDWKRWRIFWSDERCVPPDHPDSNYGMVHQVLLSQPGVKPQLVMRMAGELEPEVAAANYEAIVRELVPAAYDQVTGDRPRFDLILLGMGADGHTASLFPHTPALAEQKRLVVANPVPALQTTRLTFTFPLINAARRILVLVSGADKAQALHDVLVGPHRPDALPAQAIHPVAGQVTWLVDEAAFHLIEEDMAE